MPLITEVPFDIVVENWLNALDNIQIDETLDFNVNDGATLTVTNATNASPIQITTSAAHGLKTSDIVTITGVTGNTAANGTFVITFIDATNFTLNNTTGNGAYISGGTVQRVVNAKGHSGYLGMVIIRQQALPFNLCSGQGNIGGAGSPLRHTVRSF